MRARAGDRMTVAVVGAGIAGAACARALTGAGHPVQLFDRGRVAGGRLSSRWIEGRYVDLGASYLTARDPEFSAVVADWVARGVARPWTDTFQVATSHALGESKTGPMRYGAANGLRSLVEDLLDGLPVTQEQEVTAAGLGPGGPTIDGIAYDAVVLAMPDPQALLVLDPALVGERAAIQDRVWQPVLALAAGWAARTWDQHFDGCFVNDSDVLGWIADDGRRRGDDAAVLVAHSTSSFAAGQLADPAAAGRELLAATQRVLGLTEAPQWSQVHRWSLARPDGPREELFYLGDSQVGLCGDGWGASKVEAAWLSGTGLGRTLAAQL